MFILNYDAAKSLWGDSASVSGAFSSWQEQHWILILNLTFFFFAPAVHPQPSCRNISVGLENLKQMCAAQQTDVKNNTSSRERTCFLCCWMNKQPGLGREGLLLYVQSHISLRPPVASTLTHLFIVFSVKHKENQDWRWSWEERAVTRPPAVRVSLLPEVSDSARSTCFRLFSLLFQVGSVSFHAALLRFSSRFHFTVQP